MSKKKKKHKKKNSYGMINFNYEKDSRQNEAKMSKILDKIETDRISIYEDILKHTKGFKNKRKINKEKGDVIYNIKKMKKTKNILKKWKDENFLDKVMNAIKHGRVLVKQIARAIASLLLFILGIEALTNKLPIKFVNFMVKVFNVANTLQTI